MTQNSHEKTMRKPSLFGREEEIKQLKDTYERVCNEELPLLALVVGESGLGKSSLAKILKPASGKFVSEVIMEPYEAFATALTRWLEDLDPLRLKQLEAVECDPILFTVIPELQQFVRASTKTQASASNNSGSEVINRFRYSFCMLLQKLARISPIIILLEDIQNADVSSLELIRNIVQLENAPVLLIGTQLKDVKEDQSRLHKMVPVVETLKELKESEKLVRIRLRAYPLETQKAFLNDILKPRQSLDILTEFIDGKTKGNVFHIWQLLSLLKDQGVIHEEDGRCSWDDEEIRKVNTLNVTEVLQQTMAKLSHPATEAIKVASFLGHHIDDSALDLVLQTPSLPLLEEAASHGLLVFSTQTGGYSFTHDWVRDAARALVPPEEHESYFLKLGRRLWSASSPQALQKNVYLIASLMNRGGSLIAEPRERCKVAGLNHQAAERARRLCSYSDASAFLSTGISFLTPDCWKYNYDTAISLYVGACEADVAVGHYEQAVEWIEVVLKKAKSGKEKIPAYKALIRSMTQQGNLNDAIQVGVKALKLLKVRLPPQATKRAILTELIRLKLALRGRSTQSLLDLPLMQDLTKIQAMEILNLLVYVGYLARSPFTAIAGFRACLLTVKYGKAPCSPTAFAMYGTMLCGLGIDTKQGDEFGKLALSMTSEEIHSNEVPMVSLFYGGLVSHWRHPMRYASLDGMKLAYSSGIEKGQIDIAVNSKAAWVTLKLICGGSLSQLKSEMKQLIQFCTLHRQSSSAQAAKIVLQYILCLEGHAENPSRLTGNVIHFEDLLAEFQKSSNQTWKAGLYYFAMAVAYFFNAFERASAMAEGLVDLSKAPSAHFVTPDIRFYEGLTAIALARMGKDRGRRIKEARLKKKQLEKISKGSPESYLHRYLLLEAEYRSVTLGSSAKAKVSELYNKAIEQAKKEDYTSMEALACERASQFHASLGNVTESHRLRTRAIERYEKWGAIGKVKAMQGGE